MYAHPQSSMMRLAWQCHGSGGEPVALPGSSDMGMRPACPLDAVVIA